MIRKSDRVYIKPEWQDVGDDTITFHAVEDEHGGRVLITAELGLSINPTQVVTVAMLEPEDLRLAQPLKKSRNWRNCASEIYGGSESHGEQEI